MKKLLILALAVTMLTGLVACGKTNPAEETTTRILTTEETAAEATEAVTTTLSEAALQVQAFYGKHKATMLELADVLLRLEMIPVEMMPVDADIQMVEFTIYRSSDTFSYPHYRNKAGTEISFSEDLENLFISYHAAALEETKRDPGIEARTENGKRAVSFVFDAHDAKSVYVIYMPDGYVRLTYPDPGTHERIHASEAALEENWYIYVY